MDPCNLQTFKRLGLLRTASQITECEVPWCKVVLRLDLNVQRCLIDCLIVLSYDITDVRGIGAPLNNRTLFGSPGNFEPLGP